jgi:TatD DNase family protein
VPDVRLIDSHCHLQSDRFAADVDLVINAARLAGVERILVPGWDVDSSQRALELVERVPWLDAAVGVHPHDAAAVDDTSFRRIETLTADDRVVAIGETGLDFDRMFSPIDAQLTNLRRNLRLSNDSGKPAIIHCRSAPGSRDAHDALLVELRATRPSAVIHSYSGPLEFARAVLDLGLSISISGLAFRRGEEVTAEVAAVVPSERLLVETDSPFLSPPGAPRKRNQPEFVAITAGWVAQRRNQTLQTVGEQSVGSYDRLFRSPRRPQ